jgi:hypothetical protein
MKSQISQCCVSINSVLWAFASGVSVELQTSHYFMKWILCMSQNKFDFQESIDEHDYAIYIGLLINSWRVYFVYEVSINKQIVENRNKLFVHGNAANSET